MLAKPATAMVSYTVKGQRFSLPDILTHAISPKVRGELDTWPTVKLHSSYGDKHIELKPPAGLIVVPNATNDETRPAFYKKVVKHLRDKLHSIGEEDPNSPSWSRLCVYREIFQILIEAFSTYRPLFQEIKREYESLLLHQKYIIHKLEPTKEMAWTLLQDCDKKVIALREKEKINNIKLINMNQSIKEELKHLKNYATDLEFQIKTLKEALSAEYELRRAEGDGKRLFMLQVNDLRSHLQELTSMSSNRENKNAPKDAYLLKIALKECQETLKKVTQRNVDLESLYANVVPRNTYEEQQERFYSTETELQKMKTKNARLEADIEDYKKSYSMAICQRDFLMNKAVSQQHVIQQQQQQLLQHQGETSPQQTTTAASNKMMSFYQCQEFLLKNVARWQKLSSSMDAEELEKLILNDVIEAFSEIIVTSPTMMTKKSSRNSMNPNLSPTTSPNKATEIFMTHSEVLSMLIDYMNNLQDDDASEAEPVPMLKKPSISQEEIEESKSMYSSRVRSTSSKDFNKRLSTKRTQSIKAKVSKIK